MLVPATREQLNWAVHECVDRCLASDSALAALAEFEQELRSGGWWPDDIRAVDMTVHRLLHEIVSPDNGTIRPAAGIQPVTDFDAD